MRKFFYFLTFSLLLQAGVWVSLQVGWLNGPIMHYASQKTGQLIRFDRIDFWPIWPPNLRFVNPSVKGEWGEIRALEFILHVEPLSKPIRVDIEARSPSIELLPGPEIPIPPDQSQIPRPLPSTKTYSRPIQFSLKVSNGALRHPRLSLEQVNLNFQQTHLLKSPAQISFSGMAAFVGWPKQRVEMETSALTATDDLVKASDARIEIGGVVAQMQGASYWQQGRHRWLLKVQVNDLRTVPPLPDSHWPVRNWSGQAAFDVEVVQPSAGQPVQIDTQMDLKNVIMDVQYAQENRTAKGKVKLDLTGRIRHMGKETFVPNLVGRLDLSDTEIQISETLSKPSGTPLLIETKMKGNNHVIALEELAVEFWQIKSQIKGRISTKAPYHARLDINLAKFSVTGLQKYLLSLAKYGVEGQVALAVHGDAELLNAAKGTWNIKNFEGQELKFKLDYQSMNQSTVVKGPVTGEVKGQGRWRAGEITGLNGSAKFNLDNLEIKSDTVAKDTNEPLKVAVQVKNAKTGFDIENLRVNGRFGEASLKGFYNHKKNWTDSSLTLKEIQLHQVKEWMPNLVEVLPDGRLNGRLGLKGIYKSTEAWFNLPLQVSGNVKAEIPEYKIKIKTKPKGKNKSTDEDDDGYDVVEGSEPSGPQPFLPDGSLTDQLDVQLNVKLDRLFYGDEKISGIHALGKISKGFYSGNVDIGEVFGGSLKLSKLNVPMLNPANPMRGESSWKTIDLQRVVFFMAPQFKDIFEGKTSGTAKFESPMPGSEGFLAGVKSAGEIQARPFRMQTVQVTDALSEKLDGIPGMKSQRIKTGPLDGMMFARYRLEDSVMDLKEFRAEDKYTNLLKLSGKLTLTDLVAELSGEFHWANSPVKGCLLQGNSDPENRFVVPLKIDGPITAPEFDVIGSIAEKVAGRALRCEKEKLEAKVKEDVKKKVGEELNKKFKEILKK